MPTIDETVTIDRPRDEVWSFMADPDNIVIYNSNITDYAQERPGERGKEHPRPWHRARRGPQARLRRRGHRVRTGGAAGHPQRRGSHGHGADPRDPVRGRRRGPDAGHLPPGDRRTGGFFGKLGDNLVTRMYQRDVRSNLDKAKELLEQR